MSLKTFLTVLVFAFLAAVVTYALLTLGTPVDAPQ